MKSTHEHFDEYIVFEENDTTGDYNFKSSGDTAEDALHNYMTEWDAKEFLLMKVIQVDIGIEIKEVRE